MGETWDAVVMVILGASVTLNVFLGAIVYRVIRDEVQWRDNHHRFIHGQSVFSNRRELSHTKE